MSSMAVAGLVKSLIAVTVTLNPAAAHHGPGSYTVRPGDTLSAIAISDLTSPATAILDMSGFLLRFGPTQGPGRVLRTPGRGRPWLAGDAHDGHLPPVRREG